MATSSERNWIGRRCQTFWSSMVQALRCTALKLKDSSLGQEGGTKSWLEFDLEMGDAKLLVLELRRERVRPGEGS